MSTTETKKEADAINKRRDSYDAFVFLSELGALNEDFHALTSSQVDAIIAEADRVHYRKPRNANGSRARYFYARLQRLARRDPANQNR